MDTESHAVALQVRRRAMDLLARREHSRQELEGKLGRVTADQAVITAVLDDLATEGLQSDARYAEAVVTSKARRGHGPVRVRAELRQAGVADELIATALAASATDWQEMARAARHKRFGEAVPQDHAQRARQMRFLQRRGFDMAQIDAAFARPDME